MRLIDADSLLRGKTDHEMISTHLIWNAPTIETVTADEEVKVVARIAAKLEEQAKNYYAPIRHGHWEHGKDVFGVYYQCSECGSQYHIGYEFNYCPECGAKMNKDWDEPEINPCRGCTDYDGHGGCKSNGGCATRYCAYCGTEFTNANNND